jgi:hypothetical protein
MTREEKCKLAIEKGYTYNPETGKIFGIYGNEINRNKNGYICICLKYNKEKINLLAHQYAWYIINNEIIEQIDHINRNKKDNRICNLRSITYIKNQWNRNILKGYSWHKNAKKWQASIKVNKNRIYLGLFNTEEEARQAYINAKEKYHII